MNIKISLHVNKLLKVYCYLYFIYQKKKTISEVVQC